MFTCPFCLLVVKTVYPDVSPVSKYLLTVPGKRFRPVLLLLLRRALLGFREIPSSQLSRETSRSFFGKKLDGGTQRGSYEQRTPAAYLSQYNAAGDAVFDEPDVEGGGIELCIVQVAELIHTARCVCFVSSFTVTLAAVSPAYVRLWTHGCRDVYSPESQHQGHRRHNP